MPPSVECMPAMQPSVPQVSKSSRKTSASVLEEMPLKPETASDKALKLQEQEEFKTEDSRPVWVAKTYFTQKDINPEDRNLACLTIKTVCEDLALPPQITGTAYLMFDLVLASIEVKRQLLHIVSMTCVYLAAEHHREPLTALRLISISKASFSSRDLQRMCLLLAAKIPLKNLPLTAHDLVKDIVDILSFDWLPPTKGVDRILAAIPEERELDFANNDEAFEQALECTKSEEAISDSENDGDAEALVLKLATRKAATYGQTYRCVSTCSPEAYAVSCISGAFRSLYGPARSQIIEDRLVAHLQLTAHAVAHASWLRCLADNDNFTHVDRSQPRARTRPRVAARRRCISRKP
eukprot:m.104109 g.104109  ORF g.104109 m.104109 type:complete len:352 (+) comp15064_c1_seq2:888-1943(+)